MLSTKGHCQFQLKAMKNIAIFLVLSLLGISFKPSDNILLYKQALLDHIINLNSDTIYIIKCFDIEFPSVIGKYKIVDISDNPNSHIDSKYSLYAIKIMPIEIQDGIIEISLVDYILKRKDNEVFMSNAGGVAYCYKYERKSYKLISKSKNTL